MEKRFMVKQTGGAVMELTLSQAPASDECAERRRRPVRKTGRVEGVVIGRFAGWDRNGKPLVVFGGMGYPGLAARSTVALDNREIGCELVLMFESGMVNYPIILGILEKSGGVLTPTDLETNSQKPVRVELDGEKLVLNAGKEIVLRCGESSITLTRAGKILIRGTYVVSRSSGVNRIKGGVVHIN
jgi:hypothetical protein